MRVNFVSASLQEAVPCHRDVGIPHQCCGNSNSKRAITPWFSPTTRYLTVSGGSCTRTCVVGHIFLRMKGSV